MADHPQTSHHTTRRLPLSNLDASDVDDNTAEAFPSQVSSSGYPMHTPSSTLHGTDGSTFQNRKPMKETVSLGPPVINHINTHSYHVLDCYMANDKTNVGFRRHTLVPSDLMVVRVKTSPISFKDETVPKESAVCRFCFRKFAANDDNRKVLKARCNCSHTSLIHYDCVVEWSSRKGDYNCERCGQVTNFVPVSILPAVKPTANNSLAPPIRTVILGVQEPAPPTYYSTVSTHVPVSLTGRAIPVTSFPRRKNPIGGRFLRLF